MILNEEQLAIKNIAGDVAKKVIAPMAAHYDETEEFPWDNVKALADMGFMGVVVPEKFGGAELDTVSYVAALEEVSKACASTGTVMAVHNSAAILPILMFGTEEQKEKYLPSLASGEVVGAFALTEPGAGSDAAQVATTASITS